MTKTKKKYYSYPGSVRTAKDPNRMISIIVHDETFKMIDAIAEKTHWQKPAIVHMALLALANFHGLKKPPKLKKRSEPKHVDDVEPMDELINKYFEKIEGKGRQNG